MHELEMEVERELVPIIASGNFARAQELVSQRLRTLDESPFQIIEEVTLVKNHAATALESCHVVVFDCNFLRKAHEDHAV